MLRIACLFAVCTACSSVQTPDEGRAPAGFISGAGRLTSSRYTFDVELGHGFSQESLAGAARKVEKALSPNSNQRSTNP